MVDPRHGTKVGRLEEALTRFGKRPEPPISISRRNSGTEDENGRIDVWSSMRTETQ